MKRLKKREARGVITIFFTLLSVFFLSLLFMLIESSRYYGARAQAAAMTDSANFSVFAEYEKELLTRYNLFALDGSRGTGRFSRDSVRDLLKQYLELNANPRKESLEIICFDPWQLKLKEASLDGYALLTDGNGENFYQQAVAFMHDTPLSAAVSEIHEHYAEAAQTAQSYRENYENAKGGGDPITDAPKQEEAAEKEALEQGEITPEEIRERKAKNPLPDLAGVILQDILTSVCHGLTISGGAISGRDLASVHITNKGTLSLPSVYGGAVDNMLFEEYLLQNFPNFRTNDEEEEEEGGAEGRAGLSYQLEYILSGKRTDRANLKETALKLLAIREAFNYAASQTNPEMTAACSRLASVIIGWTGNAGLVESLTQALLIGWCYGESILDVKNLMHGALVPVMKETGQWQLTLERLGHVREMLADDTPYGSEGLRYKEYLLILLNMTPLRLQKQRGLDMIEMCVSSTPGMSQFHVNNCIVAMKSGSEWTAKPLFARVPAAFLFIMPSDWSMTVSGGFSYMTVRKEA